MGYPFEQTSDILTHHEYVCHRHLFQTNNKVDTVLNAKNMNWQSIHDSQTIDKTREFFILILA